MGDERDEGWGSVDNSAKSHYFREARSLCGGWMAFTPHWETHQELGAEPKKGDCKACWKKRAKEESRGTVDRTA